MPLNIELTDEEKERPINDWQDLGQIMHSILNRELKIAVLPPAHKPKLKKNDLLIQKKLQTILTDGAGLLNAEVEYFWTMGLRADQRLAFVDLVAIGDGMSAKVGTYEAFRGFAYYQASQAVVVHNHPSGSLDFSEADIQKTIKLIRHGDAYERPLRDHLIINATGGVNSLEKENRLDELYTQALLEELDVRKASKLLTANAIKFLSLGVAPAEVVQLTGLTLKQVDNLIKKQQQ